MLTSLLADAYHPALGGLSPERVATALNVPLAEIARLADVHRNTLARTPASPKVQARLGEIMRILTDAADLMGGDRARAADVPSPAARGL